MSFTLWMWKGFVHTAEFDDHNEDKINDNWCLDFVHRNAFMKWDGGIKINEDKIFNVYSSILFTDRLYRNDEFDIKNEIFRRNGL